jgi:hypothetical protein
MTARAKSSTSNPHGDTRGVERVLVTDMGTNDVVPMSGQDRHRVAVEAVCHERSVTRYLTGARMDNNTRLRIEAALRKLGFDRAVRPAVAS